MIVVTAWPVEDRQTGCYIIRALEVLGHTVHNVDPKVMHRAALACGDSVEDTITRALVTTIDAHRPDLVFVCRQSWFTAVAERYRHDIPVVGWNVDVRYHPETAWSNLHPLIRACSHWFTIAGGSIPWYRKVLNSNSYWLSEGCDPQVHRPPTTGEMAQATSTGMDLYYGQCEVSFAGSLDPDHPGPPNRMDLLRVVHEQFKLRVWGPSTRYLVNEAHSLMCHLVPINLGHSGWPLVALSQSARDYRVMAAGGFLLTNHVLDYERLFVPGKEFDTYRTTEEACEKIRFYLDHSDDRNRIRVQGQTAVQQHHTFLHRMQRMLHLIGGGRDSYEDDYRRWEPGVGEYPHKLDRVRSFGTPA